MIHKPILRAFFHSVDPPDWQSIYIHYYCSLELFNKIVYIYHTDSSTQYIQIVFVVVQARSRAADAPRHPAPEQKQIVCATIADSCASFGIETDKKDSEFFTPPFLSCPCDSAAQLNMFSSGFCSLKLREFSRSNDTPFIYIPLNSLSSSL